MKELTFRTSEDFKDSFINDSIQYSEDAVDIIEEAFRNGKKEAKLFYIEIEDGDYVFEIVVPRKDWVLALEAAFDKFKNAEMVNRTIDTWTLIRELKEVS